MPFDANKLNNYDLIPQLYQLSAWYTIPPNTNGFTVTNTGDTIVRVNDLILYPGTIGTNLGDSISFGGNENERYVGKLKVAFNLLPGVQPELEVVYKVFVP